MPPGRGGSSGRRSGQRAAGVVAIAFLLSVAAASRFGRLVAGGARLAFTAASGNSRAGRAPLRTARGDGTPAAAVAAPPAAPVVEGRDYDVVEDFSGNGTAFALAPNLVPLAPPAEPTVQYDVPDFKHNGFVLDNVLSLEACKKLVNTAEGIGFRERWSSALGVVTLFVDETFERQLFERMKPFLPTSVGGKPTGINRRWAIIKYGPGQHMNTHVDGNTPGTMRDGDKLTYTPNTRSYMTCLFWLADDLEGGETVFVYPQGGTWVKIPPKAGAALIFWHGQNARSNPMHHGGTVHKGYKYLVRSDIIYG